MIVLGLGSNLGDRLGYLQWAVRELSEVVSNIRCSSVYESAAMLPEGAPPEWDIAYYNMAVAGNTTLSPQEMLQAAKAVEQALGRTDRGRWGPREIDVDVLAYGQQVIEMPELVVPHTGLLQRDFALVPLAEIAPDWVHPVAGRMAKELVQAIPDTLTRLEARVD